MGRHGQYLFMVKGKQVPTLCVLVSSQDNIIDFNKPFHGNHLPRPFFDIFTLINLPRKQTEIHVGVRSSDPRQV